MDTSIFLNLRQFQSAVLPALEDHWLRDSHAVQFLEQRLPLHDFANDLTACGPAALSVFVGLHSVRALASLEKRGMAGWVNRRGMEASLRELGLSFSRHDDRFPICGLSIIQWQGPWSERPFRGSNLVRTHWIAVVHGYIFDVLWGGWLPQDVWQDIVVEDIMLRRDVRGWHVLSSYEIVLDGLELK